MNTSRRAAAPALAVRIRPPFGCRAKLATARSISAVATSRIDRARIPPTMPPPTVSLPIGRRRLECRGPEALPARLTAGAISLSSSSHFVQIEYSNGVNPVALPPGRATLSTKPAPTGSGTCTNTIGTVRLTCCKACTGWLPLARTTSASATSSARCTKIIGTACTRTVIDPYVVLFGPAQPRRACTNPARRGCISGSFAAKEAVSQPMRRIRSRCCARMAGHVTLRRRAA